MSARVLVVEDNPANLELMRYLLVAHGYEVLQAVNGADGVQRAEETRPDLILLDLHLPDITGFEVLERLRSSACADTPVVAVTAYAMVGDRERITGAGFDGYMAKPIEPETFVYQAEAFLDPSKVAARRPPVREPDAGGGGGGGGGGGEMILVVDDIPANLRLARSILQSGGYDVVSAATISDALATFRTRRPALVLSDVHIGRESGFDLVAAMRELPEARGVPIGFLSSTFIASEAGDGGPGPADFSIHRPIEPDRLLAVVRELLAGAKSA